MPEVKLPAADRITMTTNLRELNAAVDKELTSGTQISKKLQASYKAISAAIKANNVTRLAAALWELETRLTKILNQDPKQWTFTGSLSITERRWFKFPETMQAISDTLREGNNILKKNGIEIEEPTNQVWNSNSPVKIIQDK